MEKVKLGIGAEAFRKGEKGMSTLNEDIAKAKIELREAVVKIAKAARVLKSKRLALMIDELNELAEFDFFPMPVAGIKNLEERGEE